MKRQKQLLALKEKRMKKIVLMLLTVMFLLASCQKQTTDYVPAEKFNYSSKTYSVDPVTKNNIMVMKFVVENPPINLNKNLFYLEDTEELISYKVEYNANIATVTTVASPIIPDKGYFTFGLCYVMSDGFEQHLKAHMIIRNAK